jgi:alcohol dehydrogenase (cytochrome c)
MNRSAVHVGLATLALALGAFVATNAVAAKVASSGGPTAREILGSDRDSAHWTTYNKGLFGYRYSSLTAINSGNVSALHKICVFNTGWVGDYQNGPIVWNGVLYTTTGSDTFAISASTCRHLWTNHYRFQGPVLAVNSKGAAIADGRLYRGTPDGRLIAIDAATGRTAWIRKIMDPRNGEYATAAPLVWDGLIFIGKAGADLGIRGQMMAFRESDGSHV